MNEDEIIDLDELDALDLKIKRLEAMLDQQEDTHPDYIPPEVKKLQTRVFVAHAHIEVALETRILLEVKGGGLVNNWSDEEMSRVVNKVQPLLDSVPFWKKVEIVKSYGDTPEGFESRIKEINRHRNEFAHSKGSKLREKYNSSQKAKENIKKLLDDLLGARKVYDEYTLKWLEKNR